MKTFQVEYICIDDLARSTYAITNSELIEACSKYDAKRVIKRIHRHIEIKRITLYSDTTGHNLGTKQHHNYSMESIHERKAYI